MTVFPCWVLEEAEAEGDPVDLAEEVVGVDLEALPKFLFSLTVCLEFILLEGGKKLFSLKILCLAKVFIMKREFQLR